MSNRSKDCPAKAPHRIVVVGGGAAGLELASRLGNTVGKRHLADVTLVDREPTHFWKPLLHEVASGHIDASSHQIDYASHARWNHFRFEQGSLSSIDRGQRQVVIDETSDVDGHPLLPRRTLSFDTLVLALGSVTNFFSIPGAEQHAMTLETVEQAQTFRRRLLSRILVAGRAQKATTPNAKTDVSVTVIGGGATGIELAAALRESSAMVRDHYLGSVDPATEIRIRLIEGAPRVLPALPERISARAQEALRSLGIEVRVGCRVHSLEEGAVNTADGETLASDITLWAAGIKGPAVMKDLLEAPLNRTGQVVVDALLQVEAGSGIYAMGDCAACAVAPGDAIVPPRAQAAYQQAIYLADALGRRLEGRRVPRFSYRDQGTLISFGRAGAVGALMSQLLKEPLFVDGWFAASCYRNIYRRHIIGLTGLKRAAMYAAS